jgi:ferredoxin
MSKSDNLKFFKETKARANHACSTCGMQINQGDIYYPEEMKDKFLHSLHRKKLCKNCYEKINK